MAQKEVKRSVKARWVPFPSPQNDSNLLQLSLSGNGHPTRHRSHAFSGFKCKCYRAFLSFVNLYYNVLVWSPLLMYKFYRGRSVLSRPGMNGQMVTRPAHVMEKQITSQDHRGFKVEIKTVDSQESYKSQVLVLVSGSIIFRTNETHLTIVEH